MPKNKYEQQYISLIKGIIHAERAHDWTWGVRYILNVVYGIHLPFKQVEYLTQKALDEIKGENLILQSDIVKQIFEMRLANEAELQKELLQGIKEANLEKQEHVPILEEEE